MKVGGNCLESFIRIFFYQARHYIKQIVTGIEYLHSHQILHRDLKLHNLLLTKENNVVCILRE
jgi:serine/threonine protein kinase